MDVVCEKCGKKYTLNPKGLEGKRFVSKCKGCAHPIRIRVNGPPAPDPAPAGRPASHASRRPDSESSANHEQTPGVGPVKVEPGSHMAAGREAVGAGARGWEFTLFMALPILLIIASGVFYLIQVGNLSGRRHDECAEAVKRMAGYLVVEKARAVAKQCQVHLIAHPELNETNFNTAPVLKHLAVETVGRTGITFMYSVSEGEKPAKIWLNPSENMYGADLSEILPLFPRDQIERVKNILHHAQKGKNMETAGGGIIRGEAKRPREVYMALAPVAGTKFGVIAFAYFDEFTRPLQGVEVRPSTWTAGMKSALAAMIAGAILLLVAVIRLGARLERPARPHPRGKTGGENRGTE